MKLFRKIKYCTYSCNKNVKFISINDHIVIIFISTINIIYLYYILYTLQMIIFDRIYICNI